MTKRIPTPLKRQRHQLEMHTTPADIGLPCSDACSNHVASTFETQAPDRWASIASSWRQMLQIWIWCLLRLWRTIASSHSDNKKNPIRTMLLPNQFRKAHAMPQVLQMADWSKENGMEKHSISAKIANGSSTDRWQRPDLHKYWFTTLTSVTVYEYI